MNKKNFVLLIFCLFFIAIITSACKDEKRINPFANANVGDYVKMGNYPQTKDDDVKPIEWLVLAKEENKMLVVSKYGLDTKRFDPHSNDWNSSEIHKWLNNQFYNQAFDETEKKNITRVFGDNVFLLTKEQAEKYFANDYERCCEATEYAVKQGALVSNGSLGGRAGYIWWWLSSASPNYHNVYTVLSAGNIDEFCPHNYNFVIRPALWIKL